MRIGLAFVAMGILLLSTSANAAVVCQKANSKGKIKKITLRPACVGKETPLTSKDLPASGPLVKDANGVEVGALVWSDTVIRLQDGRTLLIDFRKDGLDKDRNDFEDFYYLTPDCSGQPYYYGSSPLERTQDRLANTVVRSVKVSETGTKGFIIEGGAMVVDTAIQKVYGGYINYTDTPPATCSGIDTPVGSPFACDATRFCGGIPLATTCECIACCYVDAAGGKYVLIPVTSIDFPAFAPPLTVER